MFATATPATLGRRTCAVLAAASAVLHGVMLGHAANAAMAVLMAAMIGACLFCARDLWLRGTLRAWCVVGLMNLAMGVIHLPAPAHHHAAGAVGQPSTLMVWATAVAAVEVVAAAAVLWFRTRCRAQLVVSGKPVR